MINTNDRTPEHDRRDLLENVNAGIALLGVVRALNNAPMLPEIFGALRSGMIRICERGLPHAPSIGLPDEQSVNAIFATASVPVHTAEGERMLFTPDGRGDLETFMRTLEVLKSVLLRDLDTSVATLEIDDDVTRRHIND